MIDSALDASIAVVIVLLLMALGGYIAGSVVYWLSNDARLWRRQSRNHRFSLIFIGVALCYYSFVFLPVLLVSAYSAWCVHSMRRLRREKTMQALAAIGALRAKAHELGRA